LSRLITFGCSHTFGEGLDNPNKESWPVKLSKLLDKPLINKGIGGCSNRKIQHNVIQTDFNKDDIVIILWTYADRYHFFTDEKNEAPLINVWSKNKHSLNWYKYFHTEYNETFDNKTIVNQVNLYLKEKGIEPYNFLVSNEYQYYYDITNLKTIDIDFTHEYLNKYERSKDGWHMGSKGHKTLARDIYKRISEKVLL